MFSMLAWLGRFLIKHFQVFLSLAMSLLAFLSFRSSLITSLYVFPWSSSRDLPLSSKVLHLLDQPVSSILSRWPNHYSFLLCTHSLIIFNFSLVPSSYIMNSFAETLSSGLLLHIHLTTLTWLLSNLITSSSLIS